MAHNDDCFCEKLNMIEIGSNNASIKKAAVSLLSELGYDEWIFGSENHRATFGFSTLTSGKAWKWLLLYMSKCYQQLDPVLKHCSMTEAPLLWDSRQEIQCAKSRVQKFWKDVQVSGYGSGISVPLRSPKGLRGVISVFSSRPLDQSRNDFEQNLEKIQKVGRSIHIAIERMMCP